MHALCVMALIPLVAGPSVADQTTLLDDLGLSGRWQADQWNKAPGAAEVVPAGPPQAADSGALRVTVDWPRDDEFRFFSVAPSPSRGLIPYRLQRVALWVRGEGDQHPIEVHFTDAAGKDVKVGWPAPPAGEWRHLEQPIPPEWSQPLSLSSLTWHNWGLKAAAGGRAVYLVAALEGVIDEAARLVPGQDQPEVMLAPDSPWGVADDSGKCAVSVWLVSWTKLTRALTVTDDLLDGDGQRVAGGNTVVQFDGRRSIALTRNLPRCACYRLRVAVTNQAGGKPVTQAETGLVRLAPLVPLAAEERRRSSIGVNTHFGAPWGAFQRMGIHWARDYSWGWLGRGETAPVGNGRDFASVLTDAAQHQALVLPVTQASFRNASQTGFLEDSAAIATGFERLARAFPRVPYWEIDNEFEYALRDKGFDLGNYANALRAASEGLGRVGAAKLVMNGTAGIRQDQAEVLLQGEARDSFAVVNSHFYTGTTPPELSVTDASVGGEERQVRLSFLDQLRSISRLAHAAGKESWLTEIGWDVTNGPAVGEKLQAGYLPRAYLLSRWAGADKVFWFYDRDVPNSTTIFSTCGLLRLDGTLRPSASAMAALSAHTAQAEIAGSLDFGEDTWAIVLRQPDQHWTIAAWSVKADHPLPACLAQAAAFDLFGNPCRPERLTPAVAYFELEQLPKPLDLERQASWESPTRLIGCPGGTVEAHVRTPKAALSWRGLSAGVSADEWRAVGDEQVGVLRLAATVPSGEYLLRVTAQGEGWQRSWNVTPVVQPALIVSGAKTYEPNQPEIVAVRTAGPEGGVVARLVSGSGTLAPDRFTLTRGKTQRVAVVASAEAKGPLAIAFAMDNGLREQVTLNPMVQSVAQSGTALPLVSAPAVAVTLRLSWSEAGLSFTAELPEKALSPGKAESFWDYTNVELFVDPADGSGGWTSSCRQFWFTPTKAGDQWGVAAGRWERLSGKGLVVDERCRAALTTKPGSVTITGQIPAEALGRAPRAGEAWRIAASVHGAALDGGFESGWPRLKSEGLLDGPGVWGIIKFE